MNKAREGGKKNMSQFREPNYNGTMTVTECDRIALENAGDLSRGRGYGCECNPRGENATINAEWGVRTLGTKGMGNYGHDALCPLTPRARAIAREGRIRALVADGIRRATAEIAACRQYGMEVAKLADDLVEMAGSRMDIGPSRRSFERATRIDTGTWSMPRVWAAWGIAREVAGVA